VAPYRADGLDFLAGMGPENIAEFRAAVDGDEAITAFITREADGLSTIQGAQVAAELGGLVSEADRAVLAGRRIRRPPGGQAAFRGQRRNRGLAR
jgi:hypothetical protein